MCVKLIEVKFILMLVICPTIMNDDSTGFGSIQVSRMNTWMNNQRRNLLIE